MSIDPQVLVELRAIEGAGCTNRSERAYKLMSGAARSVADLDDLVKLFAGTPSHDVIGGLLRTIRHNSAGASRLETFRQLLTVAKECKEVSGTPHYNLDGARCRSFVETLLGFIATYWPGDAVWECDLESVRPMLDAWVRKLKRRVTSSDVDLLEDFLLGAAFMGPEVLARFVSSGSRDAIVSWIENPPDNRLAHFRESNSDDAKKERIVLDGLRMMPTTEKLDEETGGPTGDQRD